MPSPLLTYVYSHDQTTGTTGYFSCVPERQMSLDESLAILAGRPLDSFLHSHVLQRIIGLPADELNALADQCLKHGIDVPLKKVLAALLLEAALFSRKAGAALSGRIDFLAHLNSNWYQATPMPHLAVACETLAPISRICFDNIQRHVQPARENLDALKNFYDSLPILTDTADSRDCSGLLHSLWETMPRGEALDAHVFTPPETVARAISALESAGILAGPEMRHEASLSPIALLRQWRIDTRTINGRHDHVLAGTATAYGRGLSLASARAACAMEIVERASAYASISPGGRHGHGFVDGLACRQDLFLGSATDLADMRIPYLLPYNALGECRDIPIHWLEASTPANETVMVPAQAVFLFCNLDEPLFLDAGGSTGLASGNTRAQARLSALTEIMERHAHATTPFNVKSCFTVASRDPRIGGLLEDYRLRGIFPQFQDISSPSGFPVFRCFVTSRDGRIIQATGAGLSAGQAVLSALTETPWPYSWATPAPFGKPTARGIPDLPVRFLEDLPDYSLASAEQALNLVEAMLAAIGKTPCYVDLDRLGIPVTRAFIPGQETNSEFDEISPPGPLLLANILKTFRHA